MELRRSFVWALIFSALSCAVPSGPLGKEGRVEGSLLLPPGARGDGYVFLYPRGEGPPSRQAHPLYVTGVSDVRVGAGDTTYVFGQVPPNPYHLWAFLDTNRRFQGAIDVLSQPGAGDRISPGLELNLQPGQDLPEDVAVPLFETHEPPAFIVSGLNAAQNVVLPDQPGAVVAFTLQSSDLGLLSASKLAFAVSLPDAGDPNAGTNGLGIPTVYPQIFFRFVPELGQAAPTDARGNPEDVIVPLAFNPAPYLIALGGDASKEVLATSLTVALVPQAQAISYPPETARVVTSLGAIPVGAYELWVIEKSGQFWRIPNDLGTQAATVVGGPVASQGVHFQFTHGNGFDAGG